MKRMGPRHAIATAVLASLALGAQANNELDLPFIRQAIQDTLSAPAVGQENKWQNPQSGNFGGIRGGAFSKGNDGSDCRNFTWTWYYNSGLESRQGFACLDARGVWRVQQDSRVSRIENVPTTPAASASTGVAPARVPGAAPAPVVAAKPPQPRPAAIPAAPAPPALPKEASEVAVVPGPTLGRMPRKAVLQ